MTFDQLYGVELTRELGSADTSQLFTTARRKAAINAAQLEWVKRTECFTRQTTIAIVDGTQEYDLETVSDFLLISAQGVSIAIVKGSTTRYIEGDDLKVTTVQRLNQEEPGWRAVSAGTPVKVYTRRDGGLRYLGFHPAPDVGSGETWTAIVPYVALAPDLAADADEPFTVSANPVKSLRPWHRALVYYAAFDLEKFRKDAAREQTQLQLWENEIQRFLSAEKPKGGQTIRMARDYRRPITSLYPRRWDPRT